MTLTRTSSSRTQYRIYHVGGKPLLAVIDAPRRLRLPSLARFQAFSMKRRWFKRFIAAAMHARMDWYVSSVVSSRALIEGLDLQAWLEHARDRLGIGELFAAVQWPAQAERRRVYLHLLDASGAPVAFVKLSAGDPEGRLANEAAALRRLSRLAPLPFAFPGILDEGEFEGHTYLVLDPLPPGAKAAAPSWQVLERSVRSYAGPVQKLSAEEKQGAPWWVRVCENRAVEVAFNAELCEFANEEITVCNAHGDLSVANLAEAGGKLWIMDWEQNDEKAPILADEISYYLSYNRRMMLRDATASVRALEAAYLRGATRERRRDVMLALAFLHYANRHIAMQVVRNWDRLRSSAAAGPRRTAAAGSAADRADTTPGASGVSQARPTLAIISNANAPYRTHLHRRIVNEIPQVRLYSVFTHGLGSFPWALQAPPEIGPVQFGQNDSVYEQGKLSGFFHEWFKGGRVIRWMEEYDVSAVLLIGYNDTGRLRIINWCAAHDVACLLFGDSNVLGDTVSGLKAWVKRKLLYRIVNKCAAILPCGREGRAYFVKYGADPRRIFYCPYEPDYALIENFPPERVEEVKKRFGLRDGRRRLVFSGRLVEVKRPDLLLEAFATIASARPEWDLVLVGDGPMRAPLEQQAAPALKDRIIWTGFIQEQGGVTAIYRASDVLVLPSDYEPWALVINEATAAGLSIVSSDVVGAAVELVRDRVNGRLFPRGNLAALIQCLLDVTNPIHVDAMKAASPGVLADWRRRADPVEGLRQALIFCGTLPRERGAP